MSDDQNPYETPDTVSGKPLSAVESLAFGEALSRGIGAANRTLLGAVLMLLIIGPMQVISSLSGALVMQGDALQPPTPGEPPSPALFLMMGYGCFTCFWLFVVLFATPWASGGIYGQVIDRVKGKAAGSFLDFGRQFYVRILLLLLIYIAVLIVLFIPLWGVGAALGAGQMDAGGFDPDKMRELSRHPLNIAASVFFGLAMTALSTVLVLVQATLVANNCRTMESISGAFSFMGQRFMDTVKLFLVFLLTLAPIAVLQQVGNFLPTITTGIMVATGCVSAVYCAYVSVLNAGIGASVYVARRPVDTAE